MNSKEYLYLFKRVPQIKWGKYEDLINLGDVVIFIFEYIYICLKDFIILKID